MPFKINNEALYPLYNMPHTQLAIEYCVKVVELWPLQTAQEMENDAKYMEDLQVGFSCMMARALLRLPDEVDISVAEAVYEGMDEIPGCDPAVVQALKKANQAYDVMRDYSETNNADLFFKAADILGIFIDAHVEKSIRSVMKSVTHLIRGSSGFEFDGEASKNVSFCYATTADPLQLTGRYLASVAVCDGLMNLMCDGIDDLGEQVIRVLPVLLYANELCEQMAIPPTCMGDAALLQLVEMRDSIRHMDGIVPVEVNSFCERTFLITANMMIPQAGLEWSYHADCLRWDPKKAEREAKEEDERKSKEALAEKFKLTKDDSSDSSEASDVAETEDTEDGTSERDSE